MCNLPLFSHHRVILSTEVNFTIYDRIKRKVYFHYIYSFLTYEQDISIGILYLLGNCVGENGVTVEKDNLAVTEEYVKYMRYKGTYENFYFRGSCINK